jgi:protein-disulfide isomerase
MAGLTVRREFAEAPRTDPPERGVPRLVDVRNEWEQIASKGRRLGPSSAPITLVVFSDFECPACRRFASDVVPALESRYPGQVARIYRHWPLTSHRFAYHAAKASECAAAQGRFESFHDVVFAQQQQLGLKSFHELAAESGVRDLDTFDSCMKVETMTTIDADIAEVTRLGGTGTPTILINGWMLAGGNDLRLLDSAAAAAALGKQPK